MMGRNSARLMILIARHANNLRGNDSINDAIEKHAITTIN